jgi:hypothetical protein
LIGTTVNVVIEKPEGGVRSVSLRRVRRDKRHESDPRYHVHIKAEALRD